MEMKHTPLTPQELNAVRQAAEEVAKRYDYIEKLPFLLEVKDNVERGRNHIKTALSVWNKYYAD